MLISKSEKNFEWTFKVTKLSMGNWDHRFLVISCKKFYSEASSVKLI